MSQSQSFWWQKAGLLAKREGLEPGCVSLLPPVTFNANFLRSCPTVEHVPPYPRLWEMGRVLAVKNNNNKINRNGEKSY